MSPGGTAEPGGGLAAGVPYPPHSRLDDPENSGRFAPPGHAAGVAARPGGPATGVARPVSPVGDAAREAGPADAARPAGPEPGRTGDPTRSQPPPWAEPGPAQPGDPRDFADRTWSGPWDGADTAEARANAWPDPPVEARAAARRSASGAAQVGTAGAGLWSGGASTGPDSAMPWPSRNDRQPDRLDASRTGAAGPDAPAQVRNARVLVMVLAAAVLLLAVPLGTLWLLGRTGDQPFNPAVGSCVKQDGGGAVAAACGDAGAYTVVSKANDPAKCTDPKQPHVVLPEVEGDNVLCLRPAASG